MGINKSTAKKLQYRRVFWPGNIKSTGTVNRYFRVPKFFFERETEESIDERSLIFSWKDKQTNKTLRSSDKTFWKCIWHSLASLARMPPPPLSLPAPELLIWLLGWLKLLATSSQFPYLNKRDKFVWYTWTNFLLPPSLWKKAET